MTAQEHIERIRAATTGIDSAINEGAKEDAYFELIDACNLDAMTAVLAHIDVQQAEIARLKAENAKLLSDVTRPESLDVGLMRAEIERLSKDAARYQWLRDGGIYILPYEDHGAGPEFDLSDASVDAGMKETS